jgi:DNA primase
VGQGSAGMAYLAGRGLSEEIIASAGARSLHLQGRDWVAFPFTGPDGEAVAFQARAIDHQPNGHRAYGPKKAGVFLTSPAALKAPTVFVTEAPIDALSLAMCGRHAIALGGVVMPDWLIKTLAFRTVALAFDNDSNRAGRKAAEELQPKLLAFGMTAFRMRPLREKDQTKGDWNMMLQALGPGRLTQWLNYYESKAVVKLGKMWERPGE